MHTHTYMHTQTCTHLYAYTHIHTGIHTAIHMYMLYIHAQTHYMHTHMHSHRHIHTGMHVYTQAYTHTYMLYTHTLSSGGEAAGRCQNQHWSQSPGSNPDSTLLCTVIQGRLLHLWVVPSAQAQGPQPDLRGLGGGLRPGMFNKQNHRPATWSQDRPWALPEPAGSPHECQAAAHGRGVTGGWGAAGQRAGCGQGPRVPWSPGQACLSMGLSILLA